VRAAQTAELAGEILGYGKRVVRTDVLLPSSSAAAVWREIHSHGGESAILLAGHEPLLSETASYLLGSDRVIVELKKGSLVCIETGKLNREPAGVLKWMLTPKLAATDTQ
jgi:phosphohistidine phosphatase